MLCRFASVINLIFDAARIFCRGLSRQILFFLSLPVALRKLKSQRLLPSASTLCACTPRPTHLGWWWRTPLVATTCGAFRARPLAAGPAATSTGRWGWPAPCGCVSPPTGTPRAPSPPRRQCPRGAACAMRAGHPGAGVGSDTLGVDSDERKGCFGQKKESSASHSKCVKASKSVSNDVRQQFLKPPLLGEDEVPIFNIWGNNPRFPPCNFLPKIFSPPIIF